MAISFNDSGALTSGSAVTSIELPIPSTNAAGELLMAFGSCNTTTDLGTIDINESGYTNQVVNVNSAGTDSAAIVESKFSTGSESGTLTLQTTGATTRAFRGRVWAVGGVHADVWDATPVAPGSGQADSTTYATPAITTNTANAVVLSVVSLEGTSTTSLTQPSGYTKLFDSVSAGGNVYLAVAYKLVASPGTETPGVWTGTQSALDWGGFTAALKAAVESTATPVTYVVTY